VLGISNKILISLLFVGPMISKSKVNSVKCRLLNHPKAFILLGN